MAHFHLFTVVYKVLLNIKGGKGAVSNINHFTIKPYRMTSHLT